MKTVERGYIETAKLNYPVTWGFIGTEEKKKKDGGLNSLVFYYATVI